ncbi:origin recognition complex subunit 6-like [Saccoglossus kowalevskii]
MEDQIVKTLAPKLGIHSAMIIRKASELIRLSEVRLSSSSFSTLNMTGSCKAVMCLDLASSSMEQPVSKNTAIRLAGVNKKMYSSIFQTLENALDLQPRLTARDVAVQFGCVQATSLAQKIQQRYETDVSCSESPNQQDAIDFRKPMYPSAAVYVACRCLKIRVDKTKVLSIAGVKRSTFDKLCGALERHALKLREGKTALSGKRSSNWIQDLDKSYEEDDSESGQPQLFESRSPRKKVKKNDFDDWKKKILAGAESAEKNSTK